MNSTAIDLAFNNTVAGNLFFLNNPLSSVLPSSFDITKDCYAVLDLRYLMTDGKHSLNAVRSAETDLKFLGSGQLSSINASSLDYLDYWRAVSNLTETLPYIEDAYQSCEDAGNYTSIPTSMVDFTADCDLTGEFYARYIFPDQADKPNDAMMMDLYEASLLEPWKDMSSYTIDFIANLTKNSQPGQSSIPLSSPYEGWVRNAASSCSAEACEGLDYVGNADIAGVGAMVAYTSIAAVSTFVALVSIFYSRKEGHSKINDALRTAWLESSLIFWDAVIWFALWACVAGLFFIYKAKSVYEHSLSVLVVLLLSNAVAILVFNYLPSDVKDDTRQDITRRVAQCLVFLMSFIVISVSLRYNPNVHNGSPVDLACYAESGLWPIKIAKVLGDIQSGLYLCIMIIGLVSMIQSEWPEFAKKIYLGGSTVKTTNDEEIKAQRILKEKRIIFIGVCSGLLLWANLGCIFYVRWKSQLSFGSSDEDNSIGYGQIIAGAFAVQAIFNFVTSIMWEYRPYGIKNMLERYQKRKVPEKSIEASTSYHPVTTV